MNVVLRYQREYSRKRAADAVTETLSFQLGWDERKSRQAWVVVPVYGKQ